MIVNKHLAKATSLRFISWLKINHPSPRTTIRFQKQPVATISIAGVTMNTMGSRKGNKITITAQKDLVKELTTIAHEWKHTLQKCASGVPIVLGGVTFAYSPELEEDANRFAKEATKKFLEENHVK